MNDPVKGVTVNHEVLEHGKRAGAPGFDGDGVAVAEMAHVQLAGGGAFLAAVGNAIDDERAGAADAFPAVGVERDRFPAARDELLIDDIEHFQERHVRDDVLGFVDLEAAGRARVLLAPDLEDEIHLRFTIYDHL